MQRLLLRLTERQRRRLLTGDVSTVVIPNSSINGKQVETLLACPSLARKNGTVARDVINYFHQPVDCHQENLEDSVLYERFAEATRRMLAIEPEKLGVLVARRIETDFPCLVPSDRGFSVLRLRDALIPTTTRLFYTLLFGRDCLEEQAELLSRSCLDVLRTIKGITLPNIELRLRALDCLREAVQQRQGAPDPWPLRDLPTDVQAKHVLGVFFHTANIQIAEFASHTLVEIAKRDSLASQCVGENDSAFTAAVLNESLRLFPLFGITNRVALRDIAIRGCSVIRAGEQIFFDFRSHQRFGYDDPDQFRPERWLSRPTAGACFMPFGAGRRRCPAERLSRQLTTAIIRGILHRYKVFAPIEHNRSLEGGALCCLVNREAAVWPRLFFPLVIAYVSSRDLVEQVGYRIIKLWRFPQIVRAAQVSAARGARPPDAAR